MNNHKKILLSIILITIVTSTSGCAFSLLPGSTDTPDDDLDNISFNNEILLRRSIDGYTNEYLPYSISDGLLYLEVDNFTDSPIEFSADFDVEIYIYDETVMEWIRIGNNIDSGSTTAILLPRSDEYYLPQLVILVPEIPPDISNNESIMVRIIVKGRIIEDDVAGEKLVGSSIEFELPINEAYKGETNDI